MHVQYILIKTIQTYYIFLVNRFEVSICLVVLCIGQSCFEFELQWDSQVGCEIDNSHHLSHQNLYHVRLVMF